MTQPGRVAVIRGAVTAIICLAMSTESLADGQKSVRTGYRWLPLPLLNFNSDTGYGYGLRFELFNYGHKRKKPYEYRLRLQLFRTTRGIQAHRLQFDLPWIRGSRWRISGGLHYVGEFKAPWYGLGGHSEYDPGHDMCGDRDALNSNPNICPDNPDFRGLYYYSYRSLTPSADLIVRYQYNGPWQLYAGHQIRLAAINPHYRREDLGQSGGSRLLEDLAAGEPIVGLKMHADGTVALSRLAEVQVGGAYDTRDHEPSPTSGSFHDFSVRMGTPLLGGQFWYGGVTATMRCYRPLDRKRRVILAARGVLDASFGDVPFYHLSRVGGINSFDSLGGFGSVRGLPRNRFVGKIKLVVNAEVRLRARTFWLRGHRLDVGGVLGVDAGRVWRELVTSNPLSAIQVAAVAGFRGVYDDSFVMSIDHGYLLNEGIGATYLIMRHMF